MIPKILWFLKKHKQTILATCSVVGLVSSVIFTASASAKIEKTKETKEPSGKDYIKAYAPAAASVFLSSFCIASGYIINRKQTEALVAAYLMLRNKSSTSEKIERSTSPEIAWELYSDDEYGKLYESTEYDVLKAMYVVNRLLSSRGYVTLNDFYKELGLPEKQAFDVVGWSSEYFTDLFEEPWVDFSFEHSSLDDGLEYTHIIFSKEPVCIVF